MRTRTNSLLAIFLLSITMACNFVAGSYPYAQKYELDYPEERVKAAIKQFKDEHPEFKVPKTTINNQGSWDLPDEPAQDQSNLFMFYFYDKGDNQIILTWVRAAGAEKTTFAFVSVNEGLDLGKWKDINKDFDPTLNKAEIKKFEDLILNKIKEKL